MTVALPRIPEPRHDPEMSNLVYKGGRSQKHERVLCPGGVDRCEEPLPHSHTRSTVICACGGSTQVQYSRWVALPDGRSRSSTEGRPVTTTDAENPHPCDDCKRLLSQRG